MKIIAGIVVVILIALGATLFFASGSENTVRAQVPDLALMQHGGEEVVLAEIEGFAVLNSWATWCPFCVQEVPDFVELQKEFEGVSVVLINRSEDASKAEAFLEGRGVNLSDLIFLEDPKDSFYKGIGGFSMPETLFVKDGEVIFHKRGFMNLSEMRDLTTSLINGTL
tara:strand:- start:13470 stop:13973 length:504 start_codon:yes stop_codon:yes gene_type:complete